MPLLPLTLLYVPVYTLYLTIEAIQISALLFLHTLVALYAPNYFWIGMFNELNLTFLSVACDVKTKGYLVQRISCVVCCGK